MSDMDKSILLILGLLGVGLMVQSPLRFLYGLAAFIFTVGVRFWGWNF